MTIEITKLKRKTKRADYSALFLFEEASGWMKTGSFIS
jgi:hypothetical protein